MSDNEMEVDEVVQGEAKEKSSKEKSGKCFEIKKWNAVCMWSWAICTVRLYLHYVRVLR
jgi:RING-box protein 1